MMEKVKLTHDQARALNRLVPIYGKDDMLVSHSEQTWLERENKCLDSLSVAELAKALYIGFEVEEEYKVGDWKKVVLLNGKWAIGQIDTLAFDDIIFNYLDENTEWQRVRQPAKASTDPTPEEIKAEQERRVWAGIGREVREFRDGDFAFSGVTGYHSNEAAVLKSWYDKGKLNGFYPAESFISFGGESHDN